MLTRLCGVVAVFNRSDLTLFLLHLTSERHRNADTGIQYYVHSFSQYLPHLGSLSVVKSSTSPLLRDLRLHNITLLQQISGLFVPSQTKNQKYCYFLWGISSLGPPPWKPRTNSCLGGYWVGFFLLLFALFPLSFSAYSFWNHKQYIFRFYCFLDLFYCVSSHNSRSPSQPHKVLWHS